MFGAMCKVAKMTLMPICIVNHPWWANLRRKHTNLLFSYSPIVIILVILDLGLSEKNSCICGDVNLIREGT
jgi:hypothetical protein